MNRKYKDKHRFVGVFERGNPKLLILDPELVSDIYVKHFNHFQVNDSSSAVSYFIKQTFRCFISCSEASEISSKPNHKIQF